MIDKLDAYTKNKNEELSKDTRFKIVNITYDIKEDVVALKCVIKDIYDNNDVIASIFKCDDGIEDDIDCWIHNAITGVLVVRDINTKLRDKQKENKSTVRVIYRFGYSSKGIKILDWDYDKIVIKLNKESIDKLIKYENNLDNILDIADYGSNVLKIASKFNSIKLHSTIGATINGSIDSILTDNMLSRQDVLDMINSNSECKGIQRVKSVFKNNELDIFALFIWEIDFDARVISTKLLGDKLMSAYDGSFIRDTSICDAIHKLYSIKASEMYSVFKA